MAGPRAPWMENITDKDPQFWKDNTYIFQVVKDTLSDKLRELMEQNNQTSGERDEEKPLIADSTGGVHVFQAILGCELHEDGPASSLERYAYDGSNYPANTVRANGTQEPGDFEEIDCSEHLKNLLKYGEESLQRRVTPGTKLYQTKANDRTFLIGITYGFYPKEIEVKWDHGGVKIPLESNELLPNPDGTYQVRTKVEVQEGDDVKTYEYHVNHSSMPETLTVTYDPPGRSRQVGLLAGLLTMTAVVLLLVAVFFRKSLKKFFTSEDTQQRSCSTNIIHAKMSTFIKGRNMSGSNDPINT
ncbi:RLA class I histocompatibility antigen, alpha chain 11/11-like [Lissotriton helveticus]